MDNNEEWGEEMAIDEPRPPSTAAAGLPANPFYFLMKDKNKKGSAQIYSDGGGGFPSRPSCRWYPQTP